ncbi:MAG: hypothetical protein ABJF11_11030 [Reichenbachiella sp.]|uniref:hypothetical protein n=1 Tax=Reichenbachiella sp. TaxID=2184521 RepID=UPI0032632473
MIQALLEIVGMLVVALAIGVYFTYRHWKAKLESIEQDNYKLDKQVEELNQANEALNQKVEQQEASHRAELDKNAKENKLALKDLQTEVKTLKSDLRASKKEFAESKKTSKELKERAKTLEHEVELKDEALGEKERELEEVTKHFKAHNISYYKQIDGKRYKAVTLVEADEAVAGVGDGRISKADAEKIFATISDGHVYTQVEKDTMHYIREHYKWTPEADELFRTKVRSWAAKGHQLS